MLESEYHVMTKTQFLAYTALGAALVAGAAHAADPAAGKQKFEATCAACHGMQGISIAPIYPNVAGQKQEYLVTQLKAFRDGSRKNPIMQPMAKGLTDADIVNIAAYLSTLKP
ncbi:MAG: Cytochrome c4 [Rhodanobacteraceae bacterium]|jgi:cytochrome c553|nr:MAG: Cytochrome c4 [Rhodanobacteraceae bacterium]